MPVSQMQNERVIALRVLCIGALLTRHLLEMRVHTLTQYLISDEDRHILIAEREAANTHLLQWIYDEHLTEHLTAGEHSLLHKPLGSWSTRALMMTSWRAETAGVLLWALRCIDVIPTQDTPFEVEDVLQPLDVMNATIDFVWCAKLRPTRHLVRMRDSAELWDWRARATELQRLGIRPSEGVDYRNVIRTTAEQAYADGTLPALIEGDFPAFGKSFARLSDDEFDLVRMIAQERYNIMSWITEANLEWDSLPVDL